MKFIDKDCVYDTEKATLVWTEFTHNKKYKIFKDCKDIKEKENFVYDSKFYITKKGEWFCVSGRHNDFATWNVGSIKANLKKYPEIYMKYFKVKKK